MGDRTKLYVFLIVFSKYFSLFSQLLLTTILETAMFTTLRYIILQNGKVLISIR